MEGGGREKTVESHTHISPQLTISGQSFSAMPDSYDFTPSPPPTSVSETGTDLDLLVVVVSGVGGAAAMFLMVVIVILLVVCCRVAQRRRERKGKSGGSSQHELHPVVKVTCLTIPPFYVVV